MIRSLHELSSRRLHQSIDHRRLKSKVRRPHPARILAMTVVAVSLIAAFLITLSGPVRAQDEKPAKPVAGQPQAAGKVTEVTLYRGQALVRRQVPIDAAAGQMELVVTDLPQHVVPDSLFAEGEGLEVRAVRFRTRAVGEEPRDEVRRLDEQIEATQTDLRRNAEVQKLLQKRSGYLDNLEKFIAGTGKTDLARGVLNAESLEKITVFAFAQRTDVLDQTVKLSDQTKLLTEQLNLLQRQRNELTSGNSRMVREAVVFLNKRKAGPASIKLNYLVDGCGWAPAYNFRAVQGEQGMQVEYHALVTQMTGENWEGVDLTLSTASPALSASVPGLAPFRVSLHDNQQPKSGSAAQGMLTDRYAVINRQLVDAQRGQNISQSLRGNLDFNWAMNSAANGLQLLELTAGRDAYLNLQFDQAAAAEGPSIDYQIDAAVSLASRSDQQMVRIMQVELPTEFYRVATPVLSQYVFREAELKNTCELALLGGPVTVYLDGRFVGRTEIPTVASGEQFVVGLGADSQMRARRELVDKVESTQGGNREIDFRYRVVLENYKNVAVPVRVMDRMPLAGNGADIRITLGEMKDPISKDALYVRMERPKGMLRWDVEVPASAAGEDARLIDYDYRVEFDRKFRLATSTKADLQREFEQIQERRIKR